MLHKVTPDHHDRRRRNQLYYRSARTADALGDHVRALEYYTAAHDLDSQYLPTVIGQADLLFRTGKYEAAEILYQSIEGPRSEVDRLQIYHRLGMVKLARGQRKAALELFAKALELDPTHRELLAEVIGLHRGEGDWQAVIQRLRQLLAVSSGHDRTRLLEEIAGIYQSQLLDPKQAIGALVEALGISPKDHQLLQKLLDLYTTTKQWKNAVVTIEQFIAIEPDPVRRGAYYHAAATICRDELASPGDVVAYCQRALDEFFTQPDQLTGSMLSCALKSFDMMSAVLATQRDWKGQERVYHDMINRLKAQRSPVFQKVRVGLFDGLGQVYRTRLENYPSAIEAYEGSQRLDPGNELRPDGADRAKMLAELYFVAGRDYADKAVELQMRMLRKDPSKYDSYTALRRIYMDTQQYDKVWCVCRTLAFLKEADPDEWQFYEQYKPRGLIKAKTAMSSESWDRLSHGDEDRQLSAILGACWQAVATMKAFPHKDFGIRRKDRRQLPGDPLMFSKLFYYVAQTLNVPLPDVYLVEDDKPVDLQLANAIERRTLCPAFVVRPHVLQGKSEREIAFLAARWLTFMRPAYYLKLLLPTITELKVVALAAIVIVEPGLPVAPELTVLVQRYLPEMTKGMSPGVLEQLRGAVARFLEAASTPDLAVWADAVEATARRAGFVMCGDLDVAARISSAEPVGLLKVKNKTEDLVLYSVSEDYFAVRQQMGVTIAG
jgi:golgin subfamily B member 1